MLRLLATPRWIGFTALVIIAILGFGLLSNWQFHRAEDKRRDAQVIVEGSAAAPVAVRPGAEPAPYAAASLTGIFVGPQLVVRQRPQDGANGWWVVTGLRTPQGLAWVVRGWLRADGPATTMPELPDPPSGELTLTGSWRPFEDVEPDRQIGLPEGMLAGIAAAALPDPGAYEGFLIAGSPGLGLEPLITEVPDDTRNLSYAWQWILFAVIAMTGWWIFLRREAREDAAAGATHAEEQEPVDARP